MADPSSLEQAAARIDGLVDRGAHICGAFDPESETLGGCLRCGYPADTHLIRDLRLSLEARTQERIAIASEQNRLWNAKDAADARLADLQAALQGLAQQMREYRSLTGRAGEETDVDAQVQEWAETLEALVRPRPTTTEKKEALSRVDSQ